MVKLIQFEESLGEDLSQIIEIIEKRFNISLALRYEKQIFPIGEELEISNVIKYITEDLKEARLPYIVYEKTQTILIGTL